MKITALTLMTNEYFQVGDQIKKNYKLLPIGTVTKITKQDKLYIVLVEDAEGKNHLIDIPTTSVKYVVKDE